MPDWWNENDCLPRIKAAVKVWCNNHILHTGMHTVRDGIWYACGNATMVAFDNASVKAYNSASVEAHGNASVVAYGNASVVAYNSTSVKAFDDASVEAFDEASVKLPKYFQTLKPVLLHDKAICINYKDHTIQSPVKWEQK